MLSKTLRMISHSYFCLISNRHALTYTKFSPKANSNLAQVSISVAALSYKITKTICNKIFAVHKEFSTNKASDNKQLIQGLEVKLHFLTVALESTIVLDQKL